MKSINLRRLLRRWGWLLIVCPLAAGGAAALVSSLLPPVYEASASMLIRPAQASPGSGTVTFAVVNDQVPQTYMQLLGQPPLLAKVASELQLSKAPEFHVTRQPGTTILNISVDSTRREVARDFTNRLVGDFIQQNKRDQQFQVEQYTARLKSQIQDVETELAGRQDRISKLLGKSSPEQQAELASLQQQVSDERARYSGLVKNLADIEAQQALASDTLVVVSPATLPATPISPRPVRNVAFAAAAGLVAAILIILLFNYLDQSITSDVDLSARTGLLPLGEVGYHSAIKEARGELVALKHEHGISEAYKALRTNLLFSSVTREMKTLIVTSAMPGEGKSRTAANLAVVLAQAGYRTLLIDADLRRPSLHRLFGRVRNIGLTNLILKEGSEDDVIIPVEEVAQLSVLSSGSTPPNPSELLGSQPLAEMLARYREAFAYVIIDTPPANAVPDAMVLATRADGVLLVVEHGRTASSAVVRAKQSLEHVQANVLGGVLNKVPAPDSYYAYPYATEPARSSNSNGHASAEMAVERSSHGGE